MRQISAALQSVQLVRSPRARVTITVEERGQSENVPALAWTQLVTNAGQSTWKPVALCSRDDGEILRFIGQAASVDRQRIADPTDPANWITPTSTMQPLAFQCTDLCAVRIPGTDDIRLFYVRTSTGNVSYIDSGNNGTSWGAATALYTGGDASGDLVAAYIDNGAVDNGPWFVGFSTYNGGTGVYTPRFGYFDGANWVTHAYDPNWRAAGIDAYGPATNNHRVFVFRQSDVGMSRLRQLDKSTSNFDNPFDLDITQAGIFGITLAYYKFFQLPESEITGGIAGESADGAGAYQGICYLNYHGQQNVDEPRIFPTAVVASTAPYAALADSTISGDTSYYFAGDTFVFRGIPQEATSETLIPIRYTYQDGIFKIELEASIPQLYVGQILKIDRTLSWGQDSGTETIRAMIVGIERGTDKVLVRAADPLAYVGMLRCRRPSILNDGPSGLPALGVAEVMRKLIGRFGIELGVDDSTLESAEVMPMTLQPMESLLAAAYRITSQSNAWLVPDNEGDFALTLINPPTSDSGDYDDTPHEYGQSGNQQPVHRAAELSDYTRLSFAYVLGTYSTDPEDGGALAMAEGPSLPNTKPLSYSITNSRYNTTTRVSNAAAAEAARQRKLSIDAELEAHANLALELHDMIEVTEPIIGWGLPAGAPRQYRVRAITEVYDRGRLTHRLQLGDDAA